MKIIKIDNCRECPHSLKTFCMRVIVPPKYGTGLNHPKHFKRLERGKNYKGFPDWCPLEDYKEKVKSTIPEPYPDDASLGGKFF